MKILQVNKFYYPKGGSETYYFNLNNLLENHGHEIIPFSMRNNKNYYTTYENYFIDNIEYDNLNIKQKINNSFKIIYNRDAEKKIEKIIEDTKPDIAHLHIFQHQLSPSILYGIKKYGIPIVNTAHDLKVICPNYKMLNYSGICERCKEGKYINCFKYKCVKNSKAASLINTIESYVHKFKKSYDLVDKFILPSNFYKNKFIEFGMQDKKLINIPNFINIDKYKISTSYENYLIYFGRLSGEKGLKTLIKAMKNIKKSKLRIIGEGPIKEELTKIVYENKIENIIFEGFKTGIELENLISNCSFVVIPSECYENAPLSLLESMAYGKAVIGSRIGGIPELIDDYNTGLLYEPGNINELSEKINYLIDRKDLAIKMGKNARVKAEKDYNSNLHYEKIMSVYKELLKKYKG